MNADLRTAYRSPTVTVTEFLCKEEPYAVSDPELTVVDAFSFVRHGSFVYESGGARTELRMHHILLENAGEYHVVRHHHTCGDECVIVEIPQRILDDVRRVHWKRGSYNFRDRRSSDRLFTRTAMPSTPVLEHLQHLLVHPAHSDGKSLERILVDSIALRLADELFVELFRMETSTIVPTPLPHKSSHHLEIVERAKEYMMTHVGQDVSLSDIAAAAHASEFHFSRIFKAVTGYSPHQYLLTMRLNHAHLLLQETKHSVTEIAWLAGFKSFSHFITIFSVKYGVSPSKARAKRIMPGGLS